MFDIGFWEIMLIAVMGLVVLGPERLPTAIRTVREWIAGVRKFSDSVKNELTEELRIQELHANLKKAEQTDMSKLSPAVAESLKTLQDAANMVNEPFKSSVETSVTNNTKTDFHQFDVPNVNAPGTNNHDSKSDNSNSDINISSSDTAQVIDAQNSDAQFDNSEEKNSHTASELEPGVHDTSESNPSSLSDKSQA